MYRGLAFPEEGGRRPKSDHRILPDTSSPLVIHTIISTKLEVMVAFSPEGLEGTCLWLKTKKKKKGPNHKLIILKKKPLWEELILTLVFHQEVGSD